MTTNLLASVVVFLSTNVTETVTQYEYYESFTPNWSYTLEIVWPKTQQIGRNPLAKTITTTITRTQRMIHEWPAGKMNTNDLVEVLESKSRFYRLERKEEWNQLLEVTEPHANIRVTLLDGGRWRLDTIASTNGLDSTVTIK